jgi:hypothetical protein
MPIRNSPRATEDLSDLNRLDELVINKKGDDLANFQTLGVAFNASRFDRFNNRIE